jgi:hypothetical protein
VESIEGLTMLTRLKCLKFQDTGVMVAEELLPLTSLTDLTTLHIADYNVEARDFRLRQVR